MTFDFTQNENELLKLFLETNLFNDSNKANKLNNSPNLLEEKKLRQQVSRQLLNYLNIELIIRPECNLKCKYCYIANYGKELYPKEERVDNKTILNNLNILLDYIYNKHQLYIQLFSLFAGDLFYDGLFFDIMDIFYKYLLEQHYKYTNLYNKKSLFPMELEVPINSTFILNDDIVNKIDAYYHKFKDIGVLLYFSISTDGKYICDTREGYELSEEIWDKLFKFAYNHQCGFHPMVSADNIDNWIENYKWWKEQLQKYRLTDYNKGDYLPPMLEVRNNNWTSDKIFKYLEFLSYLVEDRYKMCNYDIVEFTKHLYYRTDTKLSPTAAYDPIVFLVDFENQAMGCTVETQLTIRMNNLTIVPCHRTTYKQFEAGKFIIHNNQIVDIEAANISLFFTIMNIERRLLPKCNTCPIQPVCISGCLGSQYETNGELFHPCDTVCDLFTYKAIFLTKKYEQMGVFKTMRDLGFMHPKFQQTIENIKQLPAAKIQLGVGGV